MKLGFEKLDLQIQLDKIFHFERHFLGRERVVRNVESKHRKAVAAGFIYRETKYNRQKNRYII